MIKNFCIGNADRSGIVEQLLELKRQNPAIRIIDVGASLNTWSRDIVDAIVDIQEPEVESHIQVFRANINVVKDWEEIEAHVEEHGKFDFSICSHTLEDISNPRLVSEQLGKISHAGYISVPSKYRELSRFEMSLKGAYYRGYIHHRWIFTIRNSHLFGFPKINYLETDTWYDAIADFDENLKDLSFTWESEVPLKLVNDDFLGPDIASVINYYRQGLINDDVDAFLGKTYD